jgi:serine acetyltransferase
MIGSAGGLQVGNYCALASGVTILTRDHHHRDAESIPWGDARIVKPVVIGDYVWIGKNASILPGVTIGEGAIIGFGAVVAKDVPRRAIVVGNPGQVVKYRDQEAFEALKNAGAVRSPNSRCERLWIPEQMRRKYRELLQEIGFDVDSGAEWFESERSELL